MLMKDHTIKGRCFKKWGLMRKAGLQVVDLLMNVEVLVPHKVGMCLISLEYRGVSDIMLQLRKGKEESKMKSCAIYALSLDISLRTVNMGSVELSKLIS
jgi:hypothetical protein